MAENKKSVLLYCDIIFTVEELDNESAGLLFKHYLRYINDQNPDPPNQLIKIVFEPIKQNLKRDLKKWERKSERNSEIAKAGWEKRRDANASERIKLDANNADIVKVTDTVTVNVNDIYIKDLPNSTNFETIVRQTKLNKDYLMSQIQRFIPYARTSYPNFNEFADHFKSWVLKQKKEFKPLPKELK